MERFPPGGDEDVQRALADYLERERSFQARVVESLRGTRATALTRRPRPWSETASSIFTWDGLSLALLHGVQGEKRAVGHELAAVDGDPARVTVSPWPFREDEVTLACDGRLAHGALRGRARAAARPRQGALDDDRDRRCGPDDRPHS